MIYCTAEYLKLAKSIKQIQSALSEIVLVNVRHTHSFVNERWELLLTEMDEVDCCSFLKQFQEFLGKAMKVMGHG